MADAQEHFLRQRRNLMGFSTFVAVVNFTGARLDKINLFGNEVNIYQQGWLSLILLLTIIYFLARYFQYFLLLGNPVSSYILPKYDMNLGRFLLRQRFRGSDSFRHAMGSFKNIQIDSVYRMGSPIFSGGIKVAWRSKHGGGQMSDVFENPGYRVRMIEYGRACVSQFMITPSLTEYFIPVIMAVLGLISFFFRSADPRLCLT